MENKIQGQTLSKITLLVFLSILSGAAPIATDLFLPALPEMPAALGAPEAIVNLALTAYFFSQAVGMLLFGPFSDHYGRKPVLGIALVLYLSGAVLCSFAPNAWLLIAARVVEGLGGGGMVAIATALVKDLFQGKTRQNALVVMQAIVAIAPMVAPMLGSVILLFISWRGTFIAQALIGACTIPIFFRFKEPLAKEQRSVGNPLASFKGVGRVLSNKTFDAVLLCTSVCNIGFMAYLTAASYIYIDFFGLSTFQYSIFFALNSLFGVAVTSSIPLVAKKFGNLKSLNAFFLILPVFSLMHVLFSAESALAFLLCTCLVCSVAMVVRPLSVNLMMTLHDGDTGAAAAVINFFNTFLGCIGTVLVSLPLWAHYVQGVSTLMLFSSIAAFVPWVLFYKRISARTQAIEKNAAVDTTAESIEDTKTSA